MRGNPSRALKSILLVTLFAAAFGRADEASISVRTLAVEKGDMPEWHVALTGGQFGKLEWPDKQASAPVMVQAGSELALFSKAANAEGEEEFKLATKVAVPEGASELLLVGTAAVGDKPAAVSAIADNLTKAEFNDWLIINRSDLQVTLHFGKDNEPIKLEADEAGSYKVQGEVDKGGEVIAEALVKGEWKKFYSTFWSASAKQRSLVLITGEDNRAKLRRIIDFLPQDAE